MATNQSSEQEIQFKKRARRRLIGAIALVLLMVTVLPIILDNHEEQAPVPEIAISIPSQKDSEFTSKVVPVQPAANPAPDAELVPPLEKSEPPLPPKPAQVTSAPPAKPVVATPAAKPESAASKPQPEPVNSTAVKDSYMVQVGLFSDAAKVKQLQAKIAGLGIETTTLKDGGKIRLRAGPYSSKEEAVQAADKLKAAGYQTMLVRN